MKQVILILWNIWRFLMGYFDFEGKNVVRDLKHELVSHAIISGDVIEIIKTDGTRERIPKSQKNIGQLVGYCYVNKVENIDMEIVETEIDESKACEEKRRIWRSSKNLDTVSAIKFKK